MVFQNGDFRFFWTESIKDFVTIPSAWDSSLNTGLGQPQLSTLWVTSYFNFTTFFIKLGLDWNLIQIIFWVLPALLISFASSLFLFNHLFKEKMYSVLSGIIYSLNTYFLMILTGGQLGVSLAYSLVPLVFLRLIKLLDNVSLRNSILTGLALSFQLLFDPRIVYITLVVAFFYLLFNLSKLRTAKNKLSLLISFIIPFPLNSYWIIPLVLTKSSPLPIGFDSVEGFKFFSFSDFSHSLSLLHPNWPENIFGKIYFLKPEFLLLPIIAFGSLLFINNNEAMKQSNNRHILFFALLGLIGAFLSKGANPLFGEINMWLFQNVPGMSMFRDPTKFYVLIALSYSVLIPFSVYSVEQVISKIKYQRLRIQSKFQIFTFSYVLLLFTIFYLLFLIIPIFGQIKIREVPQDYVQLKDFLNDQKAFSRTLWIPQWQRFGFFSNNHPAIGRGELLEGDYKKQIEQLKKSGAEQQLRNFSVKYVVIPYDSEGEIFLDDRKYDEDKYREAATGLGEIPWLKELSGFGKIYVFEVVNPKDRFWSPSTALRIDYDFIKAAEYKVQVKNVKEGDLLIFSEGFDKNWKAGNAEFEIQNSEFENMLNSFELPKDGNYEFRVYYEPQRYVKTGLWISGATFLVLAIILLFGKRLKKW